MQNPPRCDLDMIYSLAQKYKSVGVLFFIITRDTHDKQAVNVGVQ